jgi:hypothetical protein
MWWLVVGGQFWVRRATTTWTRNTQHRNSTGKLGGLRLFQLNKGDIGNRCSQCARIWWNRGWLDDNMNTSNFETRQARQAALRLFRMTKGNTGVNVADALINEGADDGEIVVCILRALLMHFDFCTRVGCK